MKIKVTVESAWVGPREHYFNDWGTAEEFALVMRECQYKTKVEEVLADQSYGKVVHHDWAPSSVL